MRLFFSIIFFVLFCTGQSIAQNKTVARKHFQAGEYSVAKPMFEKLLQRNPRNGELNYWYAVCCYETNDTAADIKKMLEYAASRKITNAYRYWGDLLADEHQYVAASEKYETFLELSDNDSLLSLYRGKLNSVQRLNRMIRATEKVCVIDSFVVDKENFLSAYKMGRDVGKISSVANFFEDKKNGGFLSETERGNDIYYSSKQGNDTLLKLYHSTKTGDEWSRPIPLNGIETGGNDDYPFMLADGQTLYFATDGEGSIGGYDIFITRYDSEDERFLRPDNVGMPFNSTANDYMMAVNEVANLGWFASDRRQPEGKVCVYVFVPNAAKERYNPDLLEWEQLFSLSQLLSIEETQTDEEQVRKARQQQTILMYEQQDESRNGDFLFVIDNATDYTTLNDFKNPQAKSLFRKWQTEKTKYKKSVGELQKKRDAYAAAAVSARTRMADEILNLEQGVDSKFSELLQMEYEIRRLEIETIYNNK